MAHMGILRRLRRTEEGATAVEFAIVAPVFFMMMFGIIEYGLILMTKIAIESATQQVSRSAGVNKAVTGCSDRACQVRVLVQDKTFGLVNKNYVQVNSMVISSATDPSPPIPDLCTDGGAPNPPSCSYYINNDGVPGYQQAGSVTVGSVGAQNELVEIRVSYVWQVMMPLLVPFFQDGVVRMSSATVVKNEPFGP